jgi:hypothetical protein
MQLDPKAWIKSTFDHPLAVNFEYARGGEPAHQSLSYLGWIGAGARGEQQCLADRLDGQCYDDLICDFGGLAGADIANQRDVLPHQIE